jgi:hypothetical protein
VARVTRALSPGEGMQVFNTGQLLVPYSPVGRLTVSLDTLGTDPPSPAAPPIVPALIGHLAIEGASYPPLNDAQAGRAAQGLLVGAQRHQLVILLILHSQDQSPPGRQTKGRMEEEIGIHIAGSLQAAHYI